jgi:hypothetical protein
MTRHHPRLQASRGAAHSESDATFQALWRAGESMGFPCDNEEGKGCVRTSTLAGGERTRRNDRTLSHQFENRVQNWYYVESVDCKYLQSTPRQLFYHSSLVQARGGRAGGAPVVRSQTLGTAGRSGSGPARRVHRARVVPSRGGCSLSLLTVKVKVLPKKLTKKSHQNSFAPCSPNCRPLLGSPH